MPNSPNNKRSSPLRLLKGVGGLAGNEGFIGWLGRHIVLGNLIIVTLASYTGINILERFIPKSADPNLISKKELCEQLPGSGNNIKELSGTNQSTEVEVLEVVQDDWQFGCSYQLPGGDTDVYMQLKAVPKELLPDSDYNQESIDTATLNAVVCYNKDFYTSELESRGRSEDTYRISPKGAVLDKDAKDVYPVFRWKCSYETELKAQNESRDKPGKDILFVGMNLDTDYCEPEHGEELYKASYHDYNDPYSWYCTNPNPTSK